MKKEKAYTILFARSKAYTNQPIVIHMFKGELTRKNNFGLFDAKFVADFKSGKSFLLRFAVFLIFALLSVKYVTARTREFPEAETRLSPGVVKILG